MKKAIVITLAVLIGVSGVLAIGAHLASAAKLALHEPEDAAFFCEIPPPRGTRVSSISRISILYFMLFLFPVIGISLILRCL